MDELRRYDPNLKLFWQTHRQHWAIYVRMPERNKQYLSEKPNPWKGKRGLDLYAAWRQGYLHVIDVPVDKLFWSIVAPDLHRASIVAQGSLAEINRQLDDLVAQEEAESERATATWSQAAASEAFDRWAWLDRRRVSVPVEIRDGYVVTDRRAVAVGAS